VLAPAISIPIGVALIVLIGLMLWLKGNSHPTKVHASHAHEEHAEVQEEDELP